MTNSKYNKILQKYIILSNEEQSSNSRSDGPTAKCECARFVWCTQNTNAIF